MTTTAYPKIGIERAAVTLLNTHVKSRWTDLKPRYMHAVNWAAAKAATEVVHDMGYGATPAEVEGRVADVYNALIETGIPDHDVPRRGWADLAALLTAIARP